MKKRLFLICVLHFWLIAQVIGQQIPNLQKDRAYLMTRFSDADSLEGHYQSDKVLKITPAIWATQLDTIYNDSFPKSNFQIVQYQDYAMEWIWVENVFLNCTQRDNEREDFLYFQTKEIEPLKRRINFRNQDSLWVIEVRKLIQNGKLEWVKDEFPAIKFDKDAAFKLIADKKGIPLYVKVKGGIWTDWEEQICRYEPRRSSKFLTSQIQEALKERGYYDGPIDNVMTKEIRVIISKFKRDRNLSICGDDLGRLLKALEIEY